jgi:ABC-type multidrug transport system fused ATPase/permease subunit
VEQADRIIVIKEGRIVEEGVREELLKKDGPYARMLKTKR